MSPDTAAADTPSAQFALRLRVDAGTTGPERLAALVASVGGRLQTIAAAPDDSGVCELVVDTTGAAQGDELVAAIAALTDARLLDVTDLTFAAHQGGKIEQRLRSPINTRDDLARVYTPGVARVCRAIAADADAAYRLTVKGNTVAVVSDGSAVLGLGDIGPAAAMPVMEGKAALFKEFAGVDAVPLCLDTNDPDEIVATVRAIAPSFGGINLEDISAPRCFEIEDRLRSELSIPVFHDDQHGTAVVVLAALVNAAKLVGKRPQDLRVLIVGLGAAGVAVSRILLATGVTEIVACDSRGAVHRRRADYLDGSMNGVKRALADRTNPELLSGMPHELIDGMDVFIGLSGPGVIDPSALVRMARAPIVFALANPIPEVAPERVGDTVAVMATGRSDYPNQINNVLCFPGLFRGALDVRATEITEAAKLAAAFAIAGLVSEDALARDYIIPSALDRNVAPAVAAAVASALRAG
jgi:malate dehydrogenase (oxaloacetate-decarboxylating)